MTPTLRPARPEDAAQIAQVHVAAWRAAYPGLVPSSVLNALDEAARTERWQRILERPLGKNLVALDGDELVGFASFGASRDEDAEPNTGEVFAIYVAPERLRRGVGRALMERALADLAASGFERAVLWTLANHDVAGNFYRALGFHGDGAQRTQDVGGTGLSVVRFVRESRR